jgi:aminoglycoside 3-N-acetyltransferase
MWTEAKLVADLQELGLREGLAVLAHTSLRAIGPIEGGAETLLRALRHALGETGTLLVPTFTAAHRDPAERSDLTEPSEELERLRANIPLFDTETTPADTETLGVFPEIVRQQPDACRSHHPGLSFTAVGAHAEFLTRDTPFHYPLGSDSPLARLHQLNGSILLLGVDHTVNSALHLAEIWADVPYIHRAATLKTGPDTWTTMWGSPECSRGFHKIEPLLRHSRILHEGSLGNARAHLMTQQQLVSMGMALLQGERSFLLCDDPMCRACALARKLNADPQADWNSLRHLTP